MSLNASDTLQPGECPVCMDAFDVDIHLPKVFGCGHSVCAACVPGCMNRCTSCSGSHEARCPICRPETLTPEDGLPTNFDNEQLAQLLRSVSAGSSVRCADCNEHVVSSKAFACSTCSTHSAIIVCAFCAIKAHRQHELLDRDKVATQDDVAKVSLEVDAGLRALKRRAESMRSEGQILKRAAEDYVKDVHDAQARLKAATFGSKVILMEDVDGYAMQSSNLLQQANVVLNRVDSAFAQVWRAFRSVDETPAPRDSATSGRPTSSERLFEMYKIFSSCMALVREASKKLNSPQSPETNGPSPSCSTPLSL